MAYLDLNATHPFEAGVAGEGRPTLKLTPQERLVVLLSRRDPLWSLKSRRGQLRLLRWMFGIEAPHRLADARLEALRGYAVTYRLRGTEAVEAERTATTLGFSSSQLAQVRQMIDGARAVRNRSSLAGALRGPLVALAGLLFFYRATAWLTPRFDSWLVAFVMAAVALVSFAPFFAEVGRKSRTY